MGTESLAMAIGEGDDTDSKWMHGWGSSCNREKGEGEVGFVWLLV